MKLASFMYEGTRYFVCLDGGYLERSFPGVNAVPMDKLLSSAGYSTTVAQSWGTRRPQSCPVSEDAKVSKVGDKFIVSGTCGDIKFELKESEYVVEDLEETAKEPERPAEEEHPAPVLVPKEDVVIESDAQDEESEPVQEQTGETEPDAVEEEVEPAKEEPVEEPAREEPTAEPEKDEPTMEPEKGEPVAEPEMDAPVQDTQDKQRDFSGTLRGGMGIMRPNGVSNQVLGSYGKSYCTLSGSLTEPDRNSSNIISEQPANHTPNKFRGMKLGKRGQSKPAATQRVPAVASVASQKIGDSESLSEKAGSAAQPIHPKSEPPKRRTDMFASAPKANGDDFDVKAFLAELSDEQRAMLERIPDVLIGRINEFSQKPISEVRLAELGEVYCVQNRWKICGKWYAIDITSDLSRHFYCAEDSTHFAVHVKTLSGWKKYKESLAVG